MSHPTLDDWIAREAVSFSLDSPASFNAAVDRLVAALGDSVELLGLGEPTHGVADFLILRNRLFQRLVEAHGYSAIAIESSFPRGQAASEFVAGRGGDSFASIRDVGFSHAFGAVDANRQLVEWMRRYNAEDSHRVKLEFYGFDSPTEMTGTDAPHQLLHFALDYLASIDAAAGAERRVRIDAHLGDAAAWENPAAMMDPSKGIGLSPAAAAVRIETEDLIAELRVRRPELIARSDERRYLEAAQHALMAREMLNYHAGLARSSATRIADLLGLRDAMMGDNLAYAVTRERGRGKVFAFAHNSHLQRGLARWQLGPHALAWWPAGAHAHATLGPCYAVIGCGVGKCDVMGIGQPEPDTLEGRLTAAAPGPARFIPTHRGEGLPISNLSSRASRNPGYFPLTPQSLTDFDWLVVLDSAT